MLRCAVLSCTVLNCAVLCCAVLSCAELVLLAVLCYAGLSCAMPVAEDNGVAEAMLCFMLSCALVIGFHSLVYLFVHTFAPRFFHCVVLYYSLKRGLQPSPFTLHLHPATLSPSPFRLLLHDPVTLPCSRPNVTV
jgi:hypothetical protein